MPMRVASLVATAVLTVATVSLLFRHALFAAGPVALAAQGVALVLMLSARVAFGRRSFHAGANPTQGGLVTRGPYRFIRHPIYAALMVFIWAGALSHRSALN